MIVDLSIIYIVLVEFGLNDLNGRNTCNMRTAMLS